MQVQAKGVLMVQQALGDSYNIRMPDWSRSKEFIITKVHVAQGDIVVAGAKLVSYKVND